MNLSAPTEATLTALAQAAGMHAQGGFLATLALLLLAVALVDRAARRAAQRGHGGGGRASTGQTFHWRFGVALVVCAALGFVAIASGVGAGGAFVRIDHAFLEAVRSSTSARAVQVFAAITLLGDGLWLAVLCIAGAVALRFCGERVLAIGLVVAIGGNGLLNAVLKRVFERVRPPHEAGLPLAHGWSFPSGHSSGALVAYGMLAYVLMRMLPGRWHLPAVWLAAATAFSVGASRIFLEAHFASDVVGGFASGTAWLAVCIIVIERARGRRR
jgi:membrane-associated phospholipid phosphatase